MSLPLVLIQVQAPINALAMTDTLEVERRAQVFKMSFVVLHGMK